MNLKDKSKTQIKMSTDLGVEQPVDHLPPVHSLPDLDKPQDAVTELGLRRKECDGVQE